MQANLSHINKSLQILNHCLFRNGVNPGDWFSFDVMIGNNQGVVDDRQGSGEKKSSDTKISISQF